MKGKLFSGKDASKGLMRYGNFFDASRGVGGGRGLQTFGTGNSTVSFGNVTLDPSIRAIQDKGLGRIDQLYGQAGAYGDELVGNTRALRSRYLGNQSAYADAQLNPIRSQIASGRGELQRSNSLRGVAGSSFGDQSIANYDSTSGRYLRDATAQVEAEQLQALTGIDAQLTQQMFGKVASQAALNDESLQVSKDRLQQELAALGLGLDQIKTMVNAFEQSQNRAMQNRNAIAQSILGGFQVAKPAPGGNQS